MASTIIWLLTVAVVFVIHIRCTLPYMRARWRLYRALDLPSRIRVGVLAMRNPELIFDESDSPEIRALKRSYADEIKAVRPLGWKLVRIVLIGLALSLIAGVLESILKGKP
jgi:hypothetical protein